MWDEQSGTLHIQVGIGSGNKQGTFAGDHDLWRLPQADDHDTDPQHRYVAHRPVFDAAPAGRADQSRTSPAGCRRPSPWPRSSTPRPTPRRRCDELHEAQALYARADTATPPRPLVTALPHAFYPESVWQDDMELGAAEIARAAQLLGEPATPYLRKAASLGRALPAASGSTDTLNLYDVGALAHASLARRHGRVVPHGKGSPSPAGRWSHDLAAQVRQGRPARAARPVRCGRRRHRVRRELPHLRPGRHAPRSTTWPTGSHRFEDFASAQRSWLLGGNPWGVSAMVGIGSSYPRCMQHQVANLSPAPDLGAVVNGPNGAGNFEGGLGGFQDEMRHCSRPRYRAFDGQGSRYVDDVRAWQTDEPALDMTAAAILAAAAQLTREATR